MGKGTLKKNLGLQITRSRASCFSKEMGVIMAHLAYRSAHVLDGSLAMQVVVGLGGDPQCPAVLKYYGRREQHLGEIKLRPSSI
jgi:hypothetical protein